MFHERVLPTLENNIKSGNSLVSTDIYENELFEVDKKTKPFDWVKEFPEVFVERKEEPDPKEELKRIARQAKVHAEKALEYSTELSEKLETVLEPQITYATSGKGGFDVVIGNPPYGALFTDDEIKYIKSKYAVSVWRVESYLLFIERGAKLLKKDGSLGLIIPDTLLNLGFTQPSREFLLYNSRLQEIIGLPSNVFPGATVDTIILLTEKAEFMNRFHDSNILVKTLEKKQPINSITNPQKEFYVKAEDWFVQNAFNIKIDIIERRVLNKIEKGKRTISEFADMFSGIKVYEVGKGEPAQTKKIREEKPFTSQIKANVDWFPFYDGKHITRYKLLSNKNNWIKYGKWLAAPRNKENFDGEKILIRKIVGKTLIATYISETSYCNTLLFVLKLKDNKYSYKSLLAILNSILIGWYYKKKFQISEDDTFPQIMIRDILQFPLPNIDKENDTKLNKLVDRLLKLNEEKANTKLQSATDEIQRYINFCEDQINIKVYELYELTPDEIKIIEGK